MTERRVESLHLRADLARIRGEAEGTRIFRSLMTCTDRLCFAHERLQDLREIIEEMIAPHLVEWQATWVVDAPEGVFDRAMRNIRKLASEAVHHLHSASDPLASAIYWFCVLAKSREIEDRDLTLFKVRSSAAVDQRFRVHLNSIATADSYRYLAELHNRAKHVHLVKERLALTQREGLVRTAQEAVQFDAIEPWASSGVVANGYPATAIVPFLKAELVRVAEEFNSLVSLVRNDLDVEIEISA